VVFGSIVDTTTHETIVSYEVAPDSPGANLLTSYQLTQVQCGGEGLVEVFGPSDSVICAKPNHLVAAGQYDLNTETLSLTAVGT
jgi:hypothetical protein